MYNYDVLFFLKGCPRSVFGINCLNSCSVHCQVPMECDRVTGHCFNGCQPGWGDHTCNTSTFLILLYSNLLNQLNDKYLKKKYRNLSQLVYEKSIMIVSTRK